MDILHLKFHLKGFEGFLSSKEALKRRTRQSRLEDRLFSLSSKSSPAVSPLSWPLQQQLASKAIQMSAGQRQSTMPFTRGFGPSGKIQSCNLLQTRELEQQEADLAESLSASHIGRGKGPYASKVREPT